MLLLTAMENVDNADNAASNRSRRPEGDYEETGIQDTADEEPTTRGELRGAKEYAEMIVDTVRESLLILDLDLRVQSANQSFYDQFGVVPEETTGRFVYELGNGQWDIPELRELLEEVLPQDKVFNDYEVEHDFDKVGQRVMVLNGRRLDAHQLTLLAIEDVTERREAERRVRRLVHKLSEAESRERRHIADILHEDVQQQLYGAEMTGRRIRAALESDVPDEERTAKLGKLSDQLNDILDEAVETTRTLSTEVSPSVLREKNLSEMLRWLAHHMEERHGLTVDLSVEEASIVVEDRDLRALIFRLAREVLLNVVKHAEVGRASLHARVEEGWLTMNVSDEGEGFDLEQVEEESSGYVLSHMAERIRFLGGSVEVETAPGEGTHVRIAVPDIFGEAG